MEFKQRQKQADKQEQVFEEVRESKSLFETEHKQRHLEETDEAQKEEKAGFISQGFRESTMNDDIDELGGGAPEEPQYIGMEKKFIKSQQDDSDRMTAVREALDVYHHPEQNKMNKQQALDNLIKACDKYSSGRFRIFKWGRGKQRLEEVLALRERAMQEKEQIKAELERNEKSELIYNDISEDDEDARMREIAGASLGKRIVGKVGGIFGFTVINLVKILTLQPLWREKISWRPETYQYHTVKFLDRVFGRQKRIEKVDADGQVIEGEYETITRKEKSYSLKEKINSKTLQAEEAQMRSYEAMKERGDFDTFDEDEYMDQGYANEELLHETKKDLIREYQKSPRDLKAIDDYEKKLEESRLKAEKFMAYMTKYKPHVGYNMDDHMELDIELSRLRVNDFKLNSQKVSERNPFGTYAQAMKHENWFSIASATDWIKQEHLDSGSIPEDLVDQKIEESYQKFFGEEISEAEKVRLKKDFQKRFNISLMAAKTYQMANASMDAKAPYMDRDLVQGFTERQQGTLGRELPNIMLIMKDMTKEEKLDYEAEIAEADKEKQAELIRPVIQKALDMKDLSKYDYKNEEDLIAKYSVFIEEFQYGFVLNSMVTQYKSVGGTLTEEQEVHARAVAYTLCAIKSHYESMIHIMASPNYSLLGDTVEKYYNPQKPADYDRKVDELRERIDPTDMVTQNYIDNQLIFEEKGKKKNKLGMGLYHGNDAMSAYRVFVEFARNEMKEEKESNAKRKKARKK